MPCGVRTLSFACLVLTFASVGCVERLLLVRTEPPGATVLVRGREAGTTPLEHPFSFYGTVDVVLRREGYFSVKLVKTLEPPWYEFFPLDFLSEHFVPWFLKDHHLVEARLEPLPEEIGDEAWEDLGKKADAAREEAAERPKQ